MTPGAEKQISQFLAGKSEHTLSLYHHLLSRFEQIGDIMVEPTKTMIGISNNHKRIAWVTQLGRSFIHVVFPFKREYPDNLCFVKMGQVPGQNQFNHHFRMNLIDDLNDEVMGFMRLAYFEENV
ncbi:hypothetical protein HQ865_15030 [Mucilaginibacter mali]|uniref:DUF5655 domain-containing protein n=1 Tax=Mucilaginibacter mali TaxID=2740462 RepID=A0A7D4Q8W8_9SPHI|nr:DUF5655 domain-containing protein [Mucilaginibacter mali]QKJ31011.1 hypothetical protein HQ865_15030 [Mucilaginibacter mali]